MGTIIFEDFSEQPEFIGGYFDSEADEIHIDSSLSADNQMEILIHEVLESAFHEHFKHSFIEELTTALYLSMKILEERRDNDSKQ